MRNQAWANFVKSHRRAKQLTRREFAELTNMDPSYVTLIERDGYVPRKDKVVALAEALGVDVDHCCLVAGYAPERIPIRDLLSRLDPVEGMHLVPEMKRLLKQVGVLSVSRQKQLASLIEVALQLTNPAPDDAVEQTKKPLKQRSQGAVS